MVEKIQGKYFYYTDFKDGELVVPRLSPTGAVGVITEILITNQHAIKYSVSWNNGVTAWCTKHEIIKKPENGVTQY